MAPAQEHSFEEEPLPEAVVLDSDFVINVLHYRLVESGVTVVYSNLLRLDFWQGWRSAVSARGLPSEVAAQPMLLADPAAERERWYRHGDDYLKTLLSLYDRYEVRIGSRLLDRALRLLARFNLKSHDACVAAIAFHTEVADVVSLDQDFLPVEGLHVWNNGIPGRRAARRR